METIKIQPKATRLAMSEEELQRYYDEVRKSHHIFKDRKKYDKKAERRKKYV